MRTLLAALAQEPEITEYAEPYSTIATVAMGLLLLVYVAGVPATVAVAAVHWRQRTRALSPPARAVAGPATPTSASVLAPPATLATAGAGSAGEAFLHLQRLERQVLALRDTPAPAHAYPRLAAETAGLAARHGPDSTVGRHATGLLAIVEALAPLDTVGMPRGDPPPPPVVPPPQLPERLRVGLARLAATGRPIPAPWAVAWHSHRPDRWPPAADRRRDELVAAFTRRYHEMYPHGGVILVLTGARLTLSYTPAGARFGGRAIEVAIDLPEVTELPDAVRRLRAVATTALGDLHPPVTE